MDQTSQYSQPVAPTKLALVVPLTIALSIGTGGAYTYAHHEQRKDGFSSPTRKDAGNAGDVAVATTADDLSKIKSTLKLSVRELANGVGVSRQAIYNWKAGGIVKSANATRLNNLKSAADVISDAPFTLTPVMLARKISGGKSLLELISGGGDGATAAASLVKMIFREAEQRQRSMERAADRKQPTDAVSDYGSPAFSERG